MDGARRQRVGQRVGRGAAIGAAIAAAAAGLAAALAAVPDGIALALHLAGGAAIGLGVGEAARRARVAAGIAAGLAAAAVLVGAVAAGPFDCRALRARRAAELDHLFSVRLAVGALDLAEASYHERAALRAYGPARCTAARFGLATDVAGERDRALAALLGVTAAFGAGLAARLARRRAMLAGG